MHTDQSKLQKLTSKYFILFQGDSMLREDLFLLLILRKFSHSNFLFCNFSKVPALIFFRNGEPFPITPPFDARNIISQVEELAYPLVEQISDSNDLKAFISSHKKHNSAVFVGLFSSNELLFSFIPVFEF